MRYLARYTHRVAISNRRLIACDDKGVTFKWKDYRLEGRERYQVMTLATHEFIRRFLMHVLPAGFHRIRYYGLLASGKRAENIARARELLTPPIIPVDAIKAASTNADQAANTRASLPLLRRPHDHHRAVRTRRNPALSTKPANASDQDRHIMITITADQRIATRLVLAGSPPATPGLASMLAIRRLRSQITRSTCIPARSITNSLACFTLRNTPPLARARTRHAAAAHRVQIPIAACGAPALRHCRSTTSRAISCLGAFRPPAAGARG